MVRPVTTVSVVPNLPPSLERLRELAYNLRWSWDQDTLALFRRLDRDLWKASGHNPVLLLGLIEQGKVNAAAADEAFLAHFDRVCQAFDRYMENTTTTWYAKQHPNHLMDKPTIAYFSMEFGLTECLRNYSGGLGVLSGDHLKSASDLGVPLVGIGLLYQEGYFSQYLNSDGFQQEAYPINDYANLPITLMRGEDGKPLLTNAQLPGRTLYAQIWRVQVGRVPLYLLDTNIPENPLQEDRDLTDRLYGGDRRQRIRQEILMGIGGIHALSLLGLEPTVYHMNEGHSAFFGLERIRLMMKQTPGLSFQQAWEITRSSTVFTTHTPVPAGLERFGFDLIEEHFTQMWEQLGLTKEQFINLGREEMGGYQLFSMAVLAVNLSSAANGVAKLHGVVSRKLFQWMYPNVPTDEVPIGHVTNGIHVETWMSGEMADLYDRYLDPSWREDPANANTWWDIDRIPDAELWRTHERRRERLVVAARDWLKASLISRGSPQSEIDGAEEVLSPDVLTIGFARRFATYKRATLILSDRERLYKLLNSADRPVQLVFAGKAHPHDIPGKDFIREIANIARIPEFRNRIVFLENYDMGIARLMIQGVDVWLNNPRRPEEASGTSGMKVIYNGGLNFSVLDGWWDEAYDPSVGWQIGNGEEYGPEQYDLQNKIEANAIYTIMEREIAPLYYDRSRDGLPREWIAKMKHSIRKLAPFFNTHRMVENYTDAYYMPAYDRYQRLTQPDLSRGLAFAAWRQRVGQSWDKIRVIRVETSGTALKVGAEQEVHAWVELGDLTAKDVNVQIYVGNLTTHGEIENGTPIDMEAVSSSGTVVEFAGQIAYKSTGQHGVSVRVLPHHEDLPAPVQRGQIRWA